LLRRKPVTRSTSNIWTGFVDILTALLLVLVFIITIFILIQYVFSTEINNLEGEKTDLSEVIKEQDTRILLLDTKIEELLLELEELQSEKDQLNTDLENRDALIVILNGRIDEIIAEVRNLQQERVNLEESLSKRDEANLSLASQIDELLNEIVEARSEMERLDDDLESRDTLIVILNSRIGEIIAEVRNLQQERTLLEENLSEREAINLALASRIEELLTDLDEVESTKDQLSSELENRDVLIVELNTRIEEINSDVFTYQSELEKLESELVDLNEERVLLKSLISNLQETIEGLQADLNTMGIVNSGNLDAIDEKERLISDLTTQQGILRKTIANLELELAEIKKQRNDLTRELLALQGELAQNNERSEEILSDITALNSELNDLNRTIEAKNKFIAELQDRAISLQSEIRVNSALISVKDDELNRLREDNKALIDTRVSLEGEIARNNLVREELEGKQKALIEEANKNNSAIQENIALIANLQSDKSNLEESISKLNETIEGLRNDLRNLQSKDLERLALIDQLEREKKKLLSQSEELNERIANLQSEFDELTEEKGELEENNRLIQDQLLANETSQDINMTNQRKLESEIEERSNELILTRKELEEAEKSIEEFKNIIFDQLGGLIEVEDLKKLDTVQGINQVAEKLTEFLEQYSDADKQVNTYFKNERTDDSSLGGLLNASLATKVLELVKDLKKQQELIAELEAELQETSNRFAETELDLPDDQEELGLSKYQSQFLADLRDLVERVDGVEITGDRFVFSSEILFATGEAKLSDKGKEEIKKVAAIIEALGIPDDISWVLRVDGHTDNQKIIPGSEFEDNWELSQARARSVVQFLVEENKLPPEKLAATGFSEYQPVDDRNTPEARARNRRIELKLTEP